MRRFASLLAVTALASTLPACAMTPQAKRAGYVGGGAMLAAGIATTALLPKVACDRAANSSEATRDVPAFGIAACTGGAAAAATLGLAVAIAGLALVAASASATTLPDDDDHAHAPAPAFDRDAALATPAAALVAAASAPAEPSLPELTARAHAAALRGDCTYVDALATEVAGLDSSYKINTFDADPAIARCVSEAW